MDKNPENAQDLSFKGWILHDLKKYDDAIQCYKKALKYNENNAILTYDLKNALLSVGKNEESQKYRKKLLKMDKIVLEEQLENKIEENIDLFNRFGFKLKLLKRQYQCKNFKGDQRRIDLLCKNYDNQIVIIELKVVMADLNTYNQIKEYMDIIKSNQKKENVLGIVVSDGTDKEFQEKLKSGDDIYQFNIADLGFETIF